MKRKKTAEVEVLETVENELYKNARSYITKARKKVYAVANTAMVDAYWNVGKVLVKMTKMWYNMRQYEERL